MCSISPILVERFVWTFKEAMMAGAHDGLTVSHKLENFLFKYHIAPHATTQQSPCALFLGRQVRTRFDLLQPNVAKKVAGKQAVQKKQHDLHARGRDIAVGQTVMVRNLRSGDNWIPGVVINQLGHSLVPRPPSPWPLI
jgi:hypothetical protein